MFGEKLETEFIKIKYIKMLNPIYNKVKMSERKAFTKRILRTKRVRKIIRGKLTKGKYYTKVYDKMVKSVYNKKFNNDYKIYRSCIIKRNTFRGMIGKEIYYKLINNSVTKNWFRGVWSSDKVLEQDFEKECAIVINLSTENEKDETKKHWVAVIIRNNETIDFFDSYGNPPEVLGGNIAKFAAKYKNVHSNDFCLQGRKSKVCGQYCIYFIHKKLQDIRLFRMVCELPNLPKERDKYVRRYVSRL